MRTVKRYVPGNVGVPESRPAGASVIPAGSAPSSSENVYGATPPVAPSVCVYADPAVAFGRPLGVATIIGAETTSVYVFEPVAPTVSVAAIVKPKRPGAPDGVPLSV